MDSTILLQDFLSRKQLSCLSLLEYLENNFSGKDYSVKDVAKTLDISAAYLTKTLDELIDVIQKLPVSIQLSYTKATITYTRSSAETPVMACRRYYFKQSLAFALMTDLFLNSNANSIAFSTDHFCSTSSYFQIKKLICNDFLRYYNISISNDSTLIGDEKDIRSAYFTLFINLLNSQDITFLFDEHIILSGKQVLSGLLKQFDLKLDASMHFMLSLYILIMLTRLTKLSYITANNTFLEAETSIWTKDSISLTSELLMSSSSVLSNNHLQAETEAINLLNFLYTTGLLRVQRNHLTLEKAITPIKELLVSKLAESGLVKPCQSNAIHTILNTSDHITAYLFHLYYFGSPKTLYTSLSYSTYLVDNYGWLHHAATQFVEALPTILADKNSANHYVGYSFLTSDILYLLAGVFSSQQLFPEIKIFLDYSDLYFFKDLLAKRIHSLMDFNIIFTDNMASADIMLSLTSNKNLNKCSNTHILKWSTAPSETDYLILKKVLISVQNEKIRKGCRKP